MRHLAKRLFLATIPVFCWSASHAFHPTSAVRTRFIPHSFSTDASLQLSRLSSENVAEASRILAQWDQSYNTVVDTSLVALPHETEIERPKLIEAVRLLNNQAAMERASNSTMGRTMLGICAPSAAVGVATLKSWVQNLNLPRGLLHGMDEDGVPINLDGGVYIKYNSGGVYTFADVRKSQMGFDALWKPGDAMLEEYDGKYRGVYFQVELADGEFRQYLLPLDLF